MTDLKHYDDRENLKNQKRYSLTGLRIRFCNLTTIMELPYLIDDPCVCGGVL